MEEADASLLGYEIKYNFIMNLAAMPLLNQFGIISIKHLPTSQQEIQMKTNPKIWWVHLLLSKDWDCCDAKIGMHLLNKLQENLWTIIQWFSHQQGNINLFWAYEEITANMT